MTEEKLLELEKLIDDQRDEIMYFFDDSHIGQQLDEIHKKFYEDSLSVIHTAIYTERRYKEHITTSKKKVKKRKNQETPI